MPDTDGGRAERRKGRGRDRRRGVGRPDPPRRRRSAPRSPGSPTTCARRPPGPASPRPRLAALAALARYPEGLRQGDLAELMNVSPPSMTRLVEIMTEAGWIVRDRDPSDQRALLLVLTPVGQKTLDTLRSESASVLSAELADLTDAERATLEAAVPVLRKLADRHVEGPRSG